MQYQADTCPASIATSLGEEIIIIIIIIIIIRNLYSAIMHRQNISTEVYRANIGGLSLVGLGKLKAKF